MQDKEAYNLILISIRSAWMLDRFSLLRLYEKANRMSCFQDIRFGMRLKIGDKGNGCAIGALQCGMFVTDLGPRQEKRGQRPGAETFIHH
jgi:hypothetical protein